MRALGEQPAIHAQGSASVHGGAAPLLAPTADPSSAVGGLLSHLPAGRHNATSIPALSRATGMSDREVRAEIARLVVDEHVPILTVGGVYLATTPEDVDLAVRNLRARSMAMLRRCRSLRIARETLAWSPTLFSDLEV